ncbi:CPBP family intramembrane glutamic endopeptidase [Pontibacter sp. H249]|uniref:CPBP family intramembrane glutamic endopeptidase n=1 Tax=Pontibacter sp. H249 TaxID=3133420 RepID=UPI0030C34779
MLDNFILSLNQTATNVWSFIKHPADEPDTSISKSGKLQVLLKVLLIDVLICTALAGLISLVEYLGLYSSESHAVSELMRNLPIWGILLVGVVVVPFFEELIFRFGLRFRRGFIAAFFAVLLLVAGVALFKFLPVWWAVGGTLVLALLMVLYLLKSNELGNYFEQSWARAYRIIFYAAAVIFGLIHLTNFEYSTAILLLAPILVAPQVVGGLFMGYMRVKYGFFWGYYLHAAHNAVFLGLGLLFMSELEEKLNISNKNYTLVVEEHVLNSKTEKEVAYTAKDSIAFENKKLSEVISDLLQKEKVTVDFGNNRHADKSINLRYKSHAANAQNKTLILNELQELYKFDVSTHEVEKEMWDVELEDDTMLANHQVDANGLYKSVVTPVEITMENATVEDLLKTVKAEFYINLTNKTAMHGKYNFKLAKNGFEHLREELKSKYGILLQSRMVMAEQAVVSFGDR